ncbi:MAG: TonB-dependent receptor domain-containing protein [Rhodomicrobium sp.]
MNRSRVKRERGVAAALPEGWLLSATLVRERPNSPRAAGKSVALMSALAALAFGLPVPCQAHETQPAAPSASQEQVSTTLPPVVVIQPKTVTPASQPRPKSETATDGSASPAGSQPATSGPTVPGTGGTAHVGMFSLGGINLLGGTFITSDQTWYFAKQTLDEALSLAPGTNSSDGGSSRNERLIYVRGFDREQVPLMIDGVRVYMPYDNRLDFSDFVTPDIAEIQIAKGYVSVLDGPGAIGGAINLVTKRPTKELEIEAGSSITLAGNGAYEGFSSYGSVGTRQKYWYMLVTGTIYDRNGWMLSQDWQPGAPAGATVNTNQGPGWRDDSQKEDWRVSAKVGITPNATDEYTLSVIHQDSSKGAPEAVYTWPGNSRRYWDWPDRNLTNIYENTTTRIGDASYVNTKAFYMLYNDSLYSYNNSSLDTMSYGYAFKSYYNDSAYGANVEGGTDLTKWDTLKAAFFYRRDIHNEYEDMFAKACPGAAPSCVEPTLTDIQDTYSAALENTFHLTKRIDLVAGASYDWRVLDQAEGFALGNVGYGLASNDTYRYPLSTLDAFNWQSALTYRYSDDAKVYASVSDRTRFPTIFELYSLRFDTQLPNPNLVPEKATNYEIGWAGKLWNANLSTAVFYSDVTNFIENVYTNVYNPYLNPLNQWVTQSQNIGNGHFIGWEGSADFPVTSSLAAGGNITLIRRDIVDPHDPNFELTGVPDAKGIFYVKWHPTGGLTITPNVELASTRWTSYGVTPSVGEPYSVYYQLGAYTLINLSAEYEFRPGVTMNFVAHNLTDLNYSLTDGYPEPGRSFTIGMKMKF